MMMRVWRAITGKDILTEQERNLLIDSLSDYFDGLEASDIAGEQPEYYQHICDMSESIEKKLDLKRNWYS